MTPRELYKEYASAVAYISVELPDGSQMIGSAFHAGEGVYVTARHVVEGVQILEVGTTIDRYVEDPRGNVRFDDSDIRFRTVRAAKGSIRSGPFFHPTESVDVAALVVDGIDAPTIPFGSHLDDMLNDEAFITRQVLTMGYPPIPLSPSPTLLASRAEINAIIDPYDTKHPHFVLSTMARGGFSGGPCLIEWGFCLGMVTRALTSNNQAEELGYMAAVSIEPLFVCLSEHGIVPAKQKEGWGGLWG